MTGVLTNKYVQFCADNNPAAAGEYPTFYPATNISFELNNPQHVQLNVYIVQCQPIATQVDEFLNARLIPSAAQTEG